MQVDLCPFLLWPGRRKGQQVFHSPNQAVAVAQPNVPSQYFETIDFSKSWKQGITGCISPNLWVYLGHFRTLPIGYTTHAK